MKQNKDHNPTEQQQRNMQYAEERIELLDTIRDMIDIELDRREQARTRDAHTREPPDPPPRRTLWQRLASLFCICL